MSKLALALQQKMLQTPMKEVIENDSLYEVLVVENLEFIADICYEHDVDVALIEVSQVPPWDINGALEVRNDIVDKCPRCKIVFLCDSKNGDVGKKVMIAKRDELIDAFLYSNTSFEFLVATLESLVKDEGENTCK